MHDCREPLRFHASLPSYEPTPLVEAPAVSERLGIAAAFIKDESCRLDMPSFKILGASWATYRALCARLGLAPSEVAGLSALRELLAGAGPELVAATDGNHGRAVARIARLLSLNAHIFVPSDMAAARVDGIAGEGARITTVDGTYDDAVAMSAAESASGRLVISDTAWPGYEEIPGWVIDGYSTLCVEIDDSLDALGVDRPDAVVVQIGVGALATAVLRYFKTRETLVIGVEPASADAMTASLEVGHLVSVPGPHHSIMAGLNCGRPSELAWPILARSIDTMIAIDDGAVGEAMRLLAEAGIVSGESGAAGLAGLLECRAEIPCLRPESTLLVISTEGATDPVSYEAIVSSTPEAVKGRRGREQHFGQA